MQSIGEEIRKDFLALLPCPLKVPIENAFTEYIGESAFSYAIEGNANYHDQFFDTKKDIESVNDIPDIIITSGINKFYYKPFVEAYAKENLFEDIFDEDYYLNNPFGMYDPSKTYHIISMNLLVMAVDLKKLKGRKVPESWGELLDESFEKQIAIRGKDGKYCETTLLGIYKAYGEEGVKALARSVKYGWHPSQMVKMAGKEAEEAPVISIMPYFYAKMLDNNPEVQIIWPDEGAIVSPVTMLVKKERKKELDKVIEFFTSEELREICSRCYLPSPYDFTQKEGLKDKKLNWVGWKFIYKEDINKLLERLNSFFK